MEFTRKAFLSGAAIGLAGLTFFPAESFAAGQGSSSSTSGGLRSAVGQSFYAQGAGGVLVPLVLDRSVDVGSNATTEQFSLYFQVGPRYSLTEGTWRLVSASGRVGYDVFLVPAGAAKKGGSYYRADFCLLKAAR